MTLPPGFEPHHRFDFFEPSDKTALVCLDVPEMQRLTVEQLDTLGYKIHTGLFMDDCLLKLRAHPYDVVIVSEHFSGMSSDENPIMKEAAFAPAALRRKQTYVLIGNYTTNDELQAFSRSVDVVVALSDLQNLRPVIRRAASRQVEFHAPLHETLAQLAARRRDGREVGMLA